MTDETVFSPDGQYMWTGSEWIPAPPNSQPPATLPNSGSTISSPVVQTNTVDAGMFEATENQTTEARIQYWNTVDLSEITQAQYDEIRVLVRVAGHGRFADNMEKYPVNVAGWIIALAIGIPLILPLPLLLWAAYIGEKKGRQHFKVKMATEGLAILNGGAQHFQ